MKSLTRIRSTLILSYMLSIGWIRRNPSSLIYLFSTPFTILFLLYLIVGREFLPYALAGAFITILVQAGIVLVGDAAWYRLELKFQDMMVASPVPQWGYMMGLAFSELLFSSPALAILIVLLTRSGLTLTGTPTLVAVTLLTWLSLSALGFLISTHMPNIRNAWQLTILLGMIFSVLPPVYYPFEVIPPALQIFAYAAPTTHSALLLRQALGLPLQAWNPSWSWAILGGYTILLLGLALCKAAWRQA